MQLDAEVVRPRLIRGRWAVELVGVKTENDGRGYPGIITSVRFIQTPFFCVLDEASRTESLLLSRV
jgi:hypothetical protein